MNGEMIKNILLLVAVIVAIYFLWKFIAPYFVRIDHIFYTSGAPGTGKDVISCDYAIKRYKAEVRAYKLKKIFITIFKFRKRKQYLKDLEMPEFYSSIPVLIGYKKGKPIFNKKIDVDILLLKKRMPNKSVMYISDINRFISQWTWKKEVTQDNISEFISEYRQYTRGGWFIANSQASDQVAKEIRNCFGMVRNNLHFHKILFFYWVEGRSITISEGVTNVETGDADNKLEGNRTNIYGFFNPFRRRYDTYAYYGRVHSMEISKSETYDKANTNKFIDLPDSSSKNVKTEDDDDYISQLKFSKLNLFLYSVIFIIIGFILTALLKSILPMFAVFTIFGLLIYDAF